MSQTEIMVARAIAPLETKCDDSLILCDLESGDILVLNVTARAIWEAAAEPVTIAAICEQLQRRFVVGDADCLQAVTEAVDEFERRGFIRQVPAGAHADSHQG